VTGALRLAAVLTATWLAGSAAAAQADTPFFFIQLSDPQFGMFTGDAGFEQETANFEFAVAAVNRLRPAFVVVTGDLVNKPGDPAQTEEYLRITGLVAPEIPVYHVAGNHDVENEPTPDSLAAYRQRFGPDRYTFRHGAVTGLVLNSSLIHSPAGAPVEAQAQDRWLRAELESTRAARPTHLIVFQHHPWFLETADEADQYFNIPVVRRRDFLGLFREYGVNTLVSGHYHRNAVATDGAITAVTTGPVGQPLGEASSGIRVFVVTDQQITHTYYPLGQLPNRIRTPSLAGRH
jgi:3',5'-cyclic AMP phosphodiesterase CpdA